MDCREFELTLISASNLENVRKTFMKMKVHARVSIGSNPESERRTPADTHGESNPAWNFVIKYNVGESVVRHHGVMLVIKLYCNRTFGDRFVGEVHASMKDLFHHSVACGRNTEVTYPVKRGSSPSQGMLTFSYRFGECLNFTNNIVS